MSGLYGIPISGLKEGRHLIDFEIGKEFFEQFEDSEIKEGSLFANIEMDKRSSHIDLLIRISGNVRICCDRCLEMYLQPVSCENRLIVKFGESMENDDPDIISVPIDEHELDLAAQKHAKDSGITYAKAYKAVLHTPEGKELYVQAQKERGV